MNGFDNYLKNKTTEEQICVPEYIKDRVEHALESLPGKNFAERKIRVGPKLAKIAACVAIAVIFVLPNVSRAYAETVGNLPVLGDIVRVVTIRNYFYDDGKHELDIDVPQIEHEGSEAVDFINKDVGELTNALVKQFYSDLDISGNNGYGSIRVDYEVVTNTERWFTLKLAVCESAASSDTYYKFYHIDKASWKKTQLGDLFENDGFCDIIASEIKAQMTEQMARDVNISYWINGNGVGEEFTTVDAQQNFYFNESGDIVIVFDKYEVAPGSAGSPEFVISRDLLKDVLKAEFR